MAKRTVVMLMCDLHRSGDVEAVATVEVSIAGDRRTIDVCPEHLSELKATLRPWLRKAVPAKTATTRKASESLARRTGRRGDSAAVRAWAKKNGYDLPARGRIPNAVSEAYAAAGG
jgi:hypothetical protein